MKMYEAGLILEGGGMRGLFTAGVLDFFMDNDIMFKNVYGVSAGASHGCSYISNQRGRAFEINTKYRDDKRYASAWSLVKTGNYFGKEFQLDTIPNKLSPYDYEAFNNSGVNFYSVATNCESGVAEYLKVGDMSKEIEKIWASCSLPLLSKMVEIDGKKYLDGGMADSIPVNRAIKDGCKKIVVVLTRDINYRKKKNNLLPFIKHKYKNYPKLVENMENRHILYNKTIAYIRKLEKDGKIVVIRPEEEIKIGRLEKDIEKLKGLYDTGYKTAMKYFDKMNAYLEK